MKAYGVILAIGLVAAWSGLNAYGGDFPVDEQVTVTSDPSEFTPFSDPKYGQGKEEKKRWAFTVRLVGNGVEAIPTLSLKLYVVQIQNWLPQMDQYKQESVARVLEKNDVPVNGDQVEIGDITLSNTVSSASSGTWYGGFKYAGYVLEVYRDGKLADLKVGGSAVVRKAYDSYLTSKGGTPPSP